MYTGNTYQYINPIHVSNCNFHSGQAYNSGGGLYFESYFPQQFIAREIFPVLCIEILRSTFSDNSGVVGGGMATRMMGTAAGGTIHFRIDACTFRRNKAEKGAGLYVSPSGLMKFISHDIQIVETDFSENVAGERGGGILFNIQTDAFQYEEQSILLANCSFRDCRADVGAAVSVAYCYRTLQHNHVMRTVPKEVACGHILLEMWYSKTTELKMTNTFVQEYFTSIMHIM